jgi:hypothetical protein
MLLLRHAAPVVALVLLVAACQTAPAATPGGTSSATSAPGSPAATGAGPTAAGPTTATLSPEDFGGTWTFVASNPRVVAAIGDHQGGSVVITGDRYKFTAGEYSADGPIEFSGTKEVTCTASSCRVEGVPVNQLFLVDDQLVILNAGMLTPLGAFGDNCGWVDVPSGGVVTVVSTATVAGQEVPSEIRFADGTAGGTGDPCTDGHVLAWDVTATREP